MSNPAHMNALNKYIRVEMLDDRVHEGYLIAIDPCKGDLLLVKFDEEVPEEVNIISSHSLKHLQIVHDPIPAVTQAMQSLNFKDDLRESEIIKQKAAVMEWLTRNCVEFTVVEGTHNIKVLDRLIIQPPYKPENCDSQYPVVLSRIKRILSEFHYKK